MLVLFAGPPLAGKTTLARTLVDRLPHATVHVENDALRPRVAQAMGHPAPTYDGDENLATYATARELVERGLAEGVHAVHDATNLRPEAREQTAEIAAQRGAPARVVFVTVPESVRARRAHSEGEDAKRAHEALGQRSPDPSACEHPHAVVDGRDPPHENVSELLAGNGPETVGQRESA